MVERGEDVFYYITVMNESYAQPSLPAGAEADVIAGMYRFASYEPNDAIARVRLLGSGAILREAIAAAEVLANEWHVASDVFSVTSFSELARDARETERWNRLHPAETQRRCHVETLLHGETPVIAATDYVRAYPHLIAPYVGGRYVALGTDGFGRSDTRAALRGFFEVDRTHIVLAALQALAQDGLIPAQTPADAIARYAIATEAPSSWSI
jgi:pyruvate dehydrogenase E1 component